MKRIYLMVNLMMHQQVNQRGVLVSHLQPLVVWVESECVDDASVGAEVVRAVLPRLRRQHTRQEREGQPGSEDLNTRGSGNSRVDGLEKAGSISVW